MHIFLTPWKFIACINVIVTELTQRKIEVQNLTANLVNYSVLKDEASHDPLEEYVKKSVSKDFH